MKPQPPQKLRRILDTRRPHPTNDRLTKSALMLHAEADDRCGLSVAIV